MNPPIEIVDLFCGAGGTSTGIIKACEQLGLTPRLTAVNHWPVAINTHSLNHPGVRHICAPVENLDPLGLIPSHILRLLAASVECRFFSRARNSGPCDEQSRAQAWQIHRWIHDIRVLNIMMENVVEFLSWGPLHPRTKRPIKSRRGEYFRSFVQTLQNAGYTVEWRRQWACDFGDRTKRERLILMARLGAPVVWPAATHGKGRDHAYGTARQCIDWSHLGTSIFNRTRPLRPKTLKRIEDGLKQFGGSNAKPFLIHLTHHGKRRAISVDEPMPTITGANRGEIGLVQPFLTSYYGRSFSHSVDEPLPTVTTRDRIGLVLPVKRERGIDILFRMLQPSEYGAAHSFPAYYRFTGNKRDQVKQIGNSVPVELAKAHAVAILS